MGYRAHAITQHRDYGSSIFHNYVEFDNYWRYLQEKYYLIPYAFYTPEYNDEYFEIGKEVLQKEIKDLKSTPDKKAEWFADTNYAELAESLQMLLDEAPENDTYAAIEWY